MMQQPTAQQTSANDHAVRLYSLCIGLAGWLWLLWSSRLAALRASLFPLLLFAALSSLLKGLAAGDAGETGSLAGVVDLAAVWALGPTVGAWVSVLSDIAQRALYAWRRRQISPLSVSLHLIYNSGLRALVALASGAVYLRLGGTVSPGAPMWRVLPALVVALLVWFILGVLLGAGRMLLHDGLPVAVQSLRQALPGMLLIELLPLPLSFLLALAYVGTGWPAILLSGLALMAFEAALRSLWRMWGHLQERVNELGVLNEFGRALVEAQLDIDEQCQLLYAYCQKVVTAPVFVLELVQPDRERVDVVVHVEDGERKPRQTLPLTETMKWMARTRQPYLGTHVHQEGLPFVPHVIGELPQSIVLVPLLAGPDLIGALSVQSHEPQAFDQENANVLSAMGNQAAMAIANARAFDAARQRAKQLAAISQVGKRVAAVRELNALFAFVVELIRETFDYDHVALFTVDPESSAVLFQASTDPFIQVQGVQVSGGDGIVAWVAESGEPLLANDVSTEPRYRWAEALPETKAELAVPLSIEERIVGVLDVQSNEVNAFARQDLFVLQTLADQVAVAVENARLYAAREEEAWSSTALLQVSQAVSRLDKLDDIVETAVRLTPMLVGVDRCSLLLWQEDTQEFVVAEGYAGDEALGPLLDQARIQPEELPLLDQLRAERQPILLEEGSEPAADALFGAFGTLLALPLYAQGQFHGALLADCADPPSAFSARKWSILSGVADQVALAIASARLNVAQREEAWVSTALLQVAQALAASTDLEESLSKITRLLPLLVGVDHCLVLLWDEAQEEFTPGAAHGLNSLAMEAFHGMHVPLVELPILQRAAQQRRAVALDDPVKDAPCLTSLGAGLDRPSWLLMPLRSKSDLLGLLFAGYADGPRRFSDRNTGIVEGVGYQTAIAIENARLYEATLEQERTAQELHMAREIQVSFLPAECPALTGWDIAADWRAAREVGGDFYDFIPLDADHMGLVIADVSDKGMPAALFMSLCRTLIRVSATETMSPAAALQRVNELLMDENRSAMFCTAFYGVLDWNNGQLTFANAGHNPPILHRRAEPHVLPLRAAGIVLGVLEDVTLEERRVTVEPGDLLILYTDGVTEPINGLGEEFGDVRLIEMAAENSAQPCARIAESIHAAVSGFVGAQPQFDDYTLVALKRVP